MTICVMLAQKYTGCHTDTLQPFEVKLSDVYIEKLTKSVKIIYVLYMFFCLQLLKHGILHRVSALLSLLSFIAFIC